MSGFKFDFSKNFLGRGSPSPLPRPLPPIFSGFALGSGFALNSRALRALDSGFALDTRALRALDSGFALNFRLGTLVWPPQNKFLDPPLGRRTCLEGRVCRVERWRLEHRRDGRDQTSGSMERWRCSPVLTSVTSCMERMAELMSRCRSGL